MAREGLTRWGVESRHAERCLGIIEQRCLAGRTGATWQAETVHLLEGRGRLDRPAALRRMTQRLVSVGGSDSSDGAAPTSSCHWPSGSGRDVCAG